MATDLSEQENSLAFEIVDSIGQINARDWNRIVPADYPFLFHEFLHALEESGCVSNNTGWAPQHILIRNSASQNQEVIGAAPLYLKGHSWGEFIFDFNWAHSYEQAGLNYYPKLISHTPFTPVTSPKLLVPDDHRALKTRQLIVRTAQKIARQFNLSSTHWHFVSEEDSDTLDSLEFLNRSSTFEYIWNNQGYNSMDDFLGALSSRKRKKIRSERRSIGKQGISIDVVQGEDLEPAHWKLIDLFLQQTVEKYRSHKYLSLDFFQRIGQTIPENLVLFLAHIDQNPVAGSFCLQGQNKLFGRYWGTLAEFRNLHFEICYYAAIEYCIERGLSEYSAGVQGDHKLSRGFLPRIARSSHSFLSPSIEVEIGHYIDRETSHMQAYCQALDYYSAYAKRPVESALHE